MLTAEATTIAWSGVFPSPMARRMEARTLYAITMGIPQNMILKYKRLRPMISSGVFKSSRTGRAAACMRANMTTDPRQARIAEFAITCRSFL